MISFFWTTRAEKINHSMSRDVPKLPKCNYRQTDRSNWHGQCQCVRLCAFVSLLCASWCNLQVSLVQLKILKEKTEQCIISTIFETNHFCRTTGYGSSQDFSQILDRGGRPLYVYTAPSIGGLRRRARLGFWGRGRRQGTAGLTLVFRVCPHSRVNF